MLRIMSAMSLLLIANFVYFTGISNAQAATAYRCVTDKQITYSDHPCVTGQEKLIAVDPANPTATDKAAALQRARDDKARLKQIEMDEAKQQQAAQAGQKKARERKNVEARQCARLELKLKHLREAIAQASAKELPKKRQQLKQAEERVALDCGQR